MARMTTRTAPAIGARAPLAAIAGTKLAEADAEAAAPAAAAAWAVAPAATAAAVAAMEAAAAAEVTAAAPNAKTQMEAPIAATIAELRGGGGADRRPNPAASPMLMA